LNAVDPSGLCSSGVLSWLEQHVPRIAAMTVDATAVGRWLIAYGDQPATKTMTAMGPAARWASLAGVTSLGLDGPANFLTYPFGEALARTVMEVGTSVLVGAGVVVFLPEEATAAVAVGVGVAAGLLAELGVSLWEDQIWQRRPGRAS